jgi:hypothetical protein
MNGSDSAALAAAGASVLIGLVIGLASLILGIIMWWNIFSKAGYSGARSLLLLIPLVNLIIMIMFAFSKWPVLQELEQRRMQAGVPPNAPMPPYPPQYR